MRFILLAFVVATLLALALAAPLESAISSQSASKANTAVGSGNSFSTLADVSQVQAAIGGQIDALTAGNSDATAIITKALGKLPVG